MLKQHDIKRAEDRKESKRKEADSREEDCPPCTAEEGKVIEPSFIMKKARASNTLIIPKPVTI